MDIKKKKNDIRLSIWKMMEEQNIATFPRPVYNRIPNFIGAETASINILRLNQFKKAEVILVSPDAPQKHVRFLALHHGKKVIMPTPHIRNGFILLDPTTIPKYNLKIASTISGAYKFGHILKPWDLPRIDFIVIGSVAVNKVGVRLGKGGGYAELEYAILRSLCKVSEDTYIATTIHDIQLIDMDIPMEPYDLGVDIIVTPTNIIEVKPRPRKPSGILWELLTPDKYREIPLLSEIKNMLINKKHLICS